MSEPIIENRRVRIPAGLGGGYGVVRFIDRAGRVGCWIPGPVHIDGVDSGYFAYMPADQITIVGPVYDTYDEAVAALKAEHQAAEQTGPELTDERLAEIRALIKRRRDHGYDVYAMPDLLAEVERLKGELGVAHNTLQLRSAQLRAARRATDEQRVQLRARVAELEGQLAAGEWAPKMVEVLAQVAIERKHQDAKWGEQNHPNGTGGPGRAQDAENARRECKRQFAEGTGTWLDILEEEVAEAYAEVDQDKLRTELVQVAAVAVAWIEAIDRRPVDALDAPAGHDSGTGEVTVPDGAFGLICSIHGMIGMCADNTNGRTDSIRIWTEHAEDHGALEPCGSCGGTSWVDDENWSPDPDDIRDRVPITRTPGNGRIPCGSCNHGGWEEPDKASEVTG